jgi:hypothetical protein
MRVSFLSLLLAVVNILWPFSFFVKSEVHYAARIKLPSLKIKTKAELNEEFPENITFEFQSMNNTFVFWLRRKGGLIGDVSRVINHNGEGGNPKGTKINGRPYLGYRMLVLEGYPTEKEGSKAIDDIEGPIARFFVYKSYVFHSYLVL